ncbi:C4orf3 isoform 1 [Pan troglodytes]|uniref:Chromosome 4 C4orf3 homolog n=3 Tax=Pan troglodytes TaxID=9598 RepID=H2RDF6_PANTR|nr:C4orf3 isoform 1 [Pan troglodytes]
MTSLINSPINRRPLQNVEGNNRCQRKAKNYGNKYFIHCLDLEKITLSPRRKHDIEGGDKLNVKFSQLRSRRQRKAETGACALGRVGSECLPEPGARRTAQAAGLRSVSGAANTKVRKLKHFRFLGLLRSCRSEMEVDAPGVDGRDGLRERRGFSEGGRQNLDVRPQSGANGLPKHSYWLDLWLFILFDVVVFLFVYFLP